MYRIGFPGWKWAARLGVPLLLKLQITKDEETGVFIVTSPDLPGLVVESVDLAQLHKDVNDCVDMLMEEHLTTPPKHRPATMWPGDFLTA